MKQVTPSKNSHSVDSVNIKLFFPKKLNRIEELLEKIQKNEAFVSFQRKELIKNKIFDLGLDTNFIDHKVQTSGIVLEKYSTEGELNDLILIRNENDQLSSLSFETKNYSRWNTFIEEFKPLIKEFEKFGEWDVIANVLSYSDSFTWNGDENIVAKDVFNSESKYLNPAFFNSDQNINLTYEAFDVNTSQNEKITVCSNNRLKLVEIHHNLVTEYVDIRLLSDPIIFTGLETMHQANKALLKDLLLQEICDSIKLYN